MKTRPKTYYMLQLHKPVAQTHFEYLNLAISYTLFPWDRVKCSKRVEKI